MCVFKDRQIVKSIPQVHVSIYMNDMRKEQRKDDFAKSVIDLLENNVIPENDKRARKLL